MHEFHACKGRNPKELENAKEQLKGGMLLRLETSDSRMSKIARDCICFGRVVPIKEIVDGIDMVRIKDIKNLAASLLKPSNVTCCNGAGYGGRVARRYDAVKESCYMRILVVEDEKVAAFIKRGLEQESYAVDVASDGGRRALRHDEQVRRRHPDIMPPKKSGLDAQGDMRPGLPLRCFPTARDTVDDRVKG